MFNDMEMRILEMLNSRPLVKQAEIRKVFGSPYDVIDAAVQRLMMGDFIKTVEPIGEKCYIMTKKGIRGFREFKEKAAQEPKSPSPVTF